MARQILLTVGIWFLGFFGRAADGEYAVFKIPQNLLKGANAVVRFEELRFEIRSTKETVLKNHYVITILNENGEKWAQLSEYYNKHRQIESIEGALYDAFGKQLKKVKKKDIMDYSGVSDQNLIDDNRFKQHSFYYKEYPYTVEYTVEMNYRNTLFFPNWVPRPGELVAVEKSSISVTAPKNFRFRYKAFNYDKEPVVTETREASVSTWSVGNLPAISRELYAPMWHELSTMVIFGPTEFQMEEYKGNMGTWQDFGKFVHSLRAGRDQLPENVRQTVHTLTDGVLDPREKITRLYRYLQKNTRYISIQLGIGGWQPFDAKEVASKGYGDCKALANFMYSLLKEAGIKSYYTLIRAGENANYITHDFPSQQFNHVILCVPLSPGDSVWLECTSQTMQPGYLGDFTSDRFALMVDEEGGKLVRTPKYGVNENVQARVIRAKLEDNGTLNIRVDTRYTGMQQDNLHSLINHLSKEKVREYLHEELDFSTYEVNKFDYQELQTGLPAIRESLDITVSNYAAITGRRLFMLPNVMTRSGRKMGEDTARKYDIQLGYEYKDVDSVEIEIPPGYEPETMPQPVAVKTKFGNYHSSVSVRENKLVYYRSLEQFGGRYPAKDFNELAKFLDAVYKADRSRVVLVKKEEQKKAF